MHVQVVRGAARVASDDCGTLAWGLPSHKRCAPAVSLTLSQPYSIDKGVAKNISIGGHQIVRQAGTANICLKGVKMDALYLSRRLI